MKETGVNLGPIFLAAGLPEPETEVRFHTTRKWKWDWAWRRWKVALEKQGSTWTGGRHTRGAGYRNDAEKLAEGQIAGWLVIYATSDMLRDGTAFELVQKALESRGWRKS